MKMSISNSVWKYAVLSLSIVISLVDVALISIGVVALGGAGSTAGAYTIATLGFLVLTLCSLGCFASLRESYALSITFIASTLVVIVLETIFLISFAAMEDEFMTMAADRVERIWERELSKPGAMNGIQMQYKCCGKEGPQDYLHDEDDMVPLSCCRQSDCSGDDRIYAKGCASVLVKFFDFQSDNVVLILVGMIVLEVLGLAAAFYFARNVKNIAPKGDQATSTE